ncbi:hypothetical protein AHiyo6_02880 [Arthrobacter sp. Hiyo6]|nr:hypothetical protein AHiyo6_02880 [Arthrobacter sp. Hiyo6]
MTLKDNIHQLTNEHMTMADDGSFIKTPPLLAELRAAVTSDFAVGRGGSGGAGMMINSKADKLEREIKEQALAEHFEMTGNEYRGNPTTLLQAWAVAASSEWQAYLEGITTEWIVGIRALLVSKRPPWRPSIPCPACSQRFYGPEREPCLAVHYWDDEAEAIAQPAKWTANCDGCGAEWNGNNLKWLRAASDTLTTDVAHVG